MDEALERRWREGLPPFNGRTISLNERRDLLPEDLRPTALKIVGYLESHLSHDREIRVLDDWHSHDGFIVESSASSWSHLLSCCEDPTKFLTLCTGDAFVYRAFYPVGFEFLLRILIEEDDAQLDITVPDRFVEHARVLFRGLEVREEPAKTFFDGAYAG